MTKTQEPVCRICGDLDEEPYYERKQKRVYIETKALAWLLAKDVLFVYQRGDGPFVGYAEGEVPPEIGDEIAIEVNCNDLFYWASADAEPLPFTEIGAVYEMVRKYGLEGAAMWACLRRKMRPQPPLEKKWREQGLWPAELEALPPRDPKEFG